MTGEEKIQPPSLPSNARSSAAEQAKFIRQKLPATGLFAGHEWRISPKPFHLEADSLREIESLGRVLLQFYRAGNLLYRRGVKGKQPAWIAELLDQGKPRELIELQREATFKNEVPRVIRPDLLPTDAGLIVAELDSVPGGIGLTAWLNQTYADLAARDQEPARKTSPIIGGARGMIEGFASIFGEAKRVCVVVSDEAATYRPEMEWLAAQAENLKLEICDSNFSAFQEGDAIYRFFELFDMANVANATQIFDLARQKKIRLTPPPKPIFEEKLLFALLWNRNLRDFWRQNLGESFFNRLLPHVPYSWVIDPAPLPPHAALPELGLTDWQQLKALSQRERDLILKVSGFSAEAWGARGVYLGSDLSHEEWSAAVDKAISSFATSPYVLQRFEKPKTVGANYFDFEANELKQMQGRVRLCPYYFVSGEGDAARATLAGVLATICPADKKIIHGMADAILAPCSVQREGVAA